MSFKSLLSGNKVNFTSLGCPRNLVDSEVMLGILLKAGYELTPDVEEADYLVVNTCAFLEASRNESKAAIDELFQRKKSGAKVIVAGCMVNKHRSEIESAFPEVHYLLGSGDVEGILKAVEDGEKGAVLGKAKSYLEAGEVPRMISTPKNYAYLKIAEGCRKACAYCIIPKIKGPLKSKSSEQILKEFNALLAQGVKEVILIAQDLGDYGKDHKENNKNLAALLKEILTIPGDYWIRLLYLYPDEITDEIIDLMKNDSLNNESRILPYLDMPIQHINDQVLQDMKRHTDSVQIKSTITQLREKLPGIKIRTSLIVGFPGETERQFQELCEFVQEYPLDHIGIFKYSQEEGTPAGAMEQQIPDEIKQRRLNKLAKIQQKISEKLNQKMVGKTLPVVIEGYHPESKLLMVGRYYGQCPEIDGQIIINDGRGVTAFNERYMVEITAAAGYDLIGRVVKAPSSPAQLNSLPKPKKSGLKIVS